ncbi:MAG TPA: adenosylcobinamide amidohydrolase [Acidimicrobiales bacterium]|nr:adenosylcobinamide amidohydrolase [Acidimicrobiales bacterium]
MRVRSRREGGSAYPVLVWRAAGPMRMVATAPHGGGIGPRRWIMNAQVPASYGRRDPDHHLAKLAVSLGLPGRGVGMLTAADVRQVRSAVDGGVEVAATVGLVHPIWAAAPDDPSARSLIGTVNVVVVLPERLSDAALVNAVATATEAKAQALWDAGVEATGTATDAVCVACPEDARRNAFGGPRSIWGSRLARAVHAAISAGLRGPNAVSGLRGPNAVAALRGPNAIEGR